MSRLAALRLRHGYGRVYDPATAERIAAAAGRRPDVFAGRDAIARQRELRGLPREADGDAGVAGRGGSEWVDGGVGVDGSADAGGGSGLGRGRLHRRGGRRLRGARGGRRGRDAGWRG